MLGQAANVEAVVIDLGVGHRTDELFGRRDDRLRSPATLLARDRACHGSVALVVPFKRIPEEAVVEKMKQYHPFFERSQDALVLRVDQKYGAGNFRNWALFLECTLKTAADLGLDHLSNELIDGVLATLNKTPGRRGDGPLDDAEAA